MWFKVYLISADTHTSDTLSNLVYINLLNENNGLIIQRRIKVENGTGYGNITIGKDLNTGVYTLISYTNWMLNFDNSLLFEKKIRIYNPVALTRLAPIRDDFLDFALFPEGGVLVPSIPNRIAFEGARRDGLPITLEGSLIDENDNKILSYLQYLVQTNYPIYHQKVLGYSFG